MDFGSGTALMSQNIWIKSQNRSRNGGSTRITDWRVIFGEKKLRIADLSADMSFMKEIKRPGQCSHKGREQRGRANLLAAICRSPRLSPQCLPYSLSFCSSSLCAVFITYWSMNVCTWRILPLTLYSVGSNVCSSPNIQQDCSICSRKIKVTI